METSTPVVPRGRVGTAPAMSGSLLSCSPCNLVTIHRLTHTCTIPVLSKVGNRGAERERVGEGDAGSTVGEFWRAVRAKVWVQPGRTRWRPRLCRGYCSVQRWDAVRARGCSGPDTPH